MSEVIQKATSVISMPDGTYAIYAEVTMDGVTYFGRENYWSIVRTTDGKNMQPIVDEMTVAKLNWVIERDIAIAARNSIIEATVEENNKPSIIEGK